MLNPQNLVPCTPENARERQLLSAKKRSQNCQDRNILIRSVREIMNSNMDVSDKMRIASDAIGVKLGKKAPFGKVALVTLMQRALKDGNYKSFVELAKLGGIHFDQSPEALGSIENPINISKTTKISAARIKEISEGLEDEC